jgi:hypothetical protein
MENYAKYAVIERKRDKLIDARFTQGQRANYGHKTSFKTRTAGGLDGLEGNVSDILQGAA